MDREKIFIIDDDYSIRELLKAILDTLYDIETADSGEMALKKLESFSPDLILLDVMLPDISGFDLCRLIKRQKHFINTPIIILTAKTSDKDLEKGFDAGAIDYIKKSFSYVELKARIKTYLKLNHYIKNHNQIQENLVTEKEKAAILIRRKSEFLANMSHEIRTPMTAIMGMSKLLLETDLSEEQKEYASSICTSSEILLNLINDILDFSKIDSGKLNLVNKEFDLTKVITDSISLISFNAFDKGLKLNTFFKNDFNCNYIGDDGRIRQILLNLLSNAIKFTNTGSVSINIESAAYDEEHDEISIEVIDTGIGITEENQKKLFQDFTQIDSSLTRKYAGTGLGLAITKKLVNAMDGDILLESKENSGSRFYFNIKLKKGKSNIKEYENLDLNSLIITGNLRTYEILSSYFKSFGCEAFHAQNLESSFNFLADYNRIGKIIDIVLIDYRVNNMDGWFLAKEIISNQFRGSAKLILLTQTKTIMEEAKMKNLNWFDGYIQKPVIKDELYGVLKKVMSEPIEVRPIDDVSGHDDEPIIENSERIKLLVAEDNEVNQKLISAILKKLKIPFTIANDGLEAVDLASNNKFDLLFMDIQMPNMNGYEATQALREKRNDIPIIAISANAYEDDIKKGIEVGMNDYITKPYNKNSVINMINKWVKK